MKNLIKILKKITLIVALAATFAGCSDMPAPDLIPGEKPTTPNSLTIRIPIPTSELRSKAETRADYNINSEEGTVSDLHLLIYKDSDLSAPITNYSWAQNQIIDFEDREEGIVATTVTNLPKNETFTLIVMANTDNQSYEGEAPDLINISVDELKEKILDWEELPEAAYLPMVFMQSGIEAENGATILATMTIGAVKFRYNIVFDSRIFGAQEEEAKANMPTALKITGVTLENTADKAYLLENSQGRFTRSNALVHSGKHYSLSGVEVADYFTADNITDGLASDMIKVDGLDEKSAEWDKPWVYQGTIYIPERYEANRGNATSMTVTAEVMDGNGNKITDTEFIVANIAEGSSDSGLDMPRGKYYELVGKIGTPGNSLVTEVTIQDWNSQTLVYALHGPYELVVEKTESVPVSSGKWTILGFRSDIPDEQIKISSELMPVISDGTTSYPLYYGEPILSGTTDENGDPYVFADEWPSHIRVTINPEIPYALLQQLEIEGLVDGKYAEGETVYKFDGQIVDYFHITAGNLHKRIGVGPLDRDPVLIVSPQIITVNLQEKMSDVIYGEEHIISFQTNINITDQEEFTLTITDEEGNAVNLFAGVGLSSIQSAVYAMQLSGDSGIYSSTAESNVFRLNVKNGLFTLNLSEFLAGNTFWQGSGVYTLTFRLTSTRLNIEALEDSVTIDIKPYNSNYTIHFKDNTKVWKSPHIYVYQLLTMPIDLYNREGDPNSGISVLAGKTVGYKDGGGNFQGAIQYQFSNNVSFRGWKGYGGPESVYTNPYQVATYSTTSIVTDPDYTMGFVILGEKPAADRDGVVRNWSDWMNPWGDNEARFIVYNYEGNLNSEHEKGMASWVCEECKNANSDYNGPFNNRSWPGIVMEKEEDGWWKYTLSGVAQTGRTMIMFSDGHASYFVDQKCGCADNHNSDSSNAKCECDGCTSYSDCECDNCLEFDSTKGDREDYRWPADSQVGIPLFEYTDNEGWFLFDGNSTNHDQNFTDDQPKMFDMGGEQYPGYFTARMAANMRIMIEKPSRTTFQEMVIEGGSDNIKVEEMIESGNYLYADLNANVAGWDAFDLGVFTNGNYGKIKLRPASFTFENGKYVARVKLEFKGGEKLYLKWRDWDHSQVKNNLKLFWDTSGTWIDITTLSTAPLISNYRCIEYTVPVPPAGANPRVIWAQPYVGSSYYGVNEKIDIYKIQQNYYPADERYHVIMYKEK